MVSGRVLIVEDDTKLRDMLCDLLTHQGFEAECAGTGAAALAAASDGIDVVLLDYRLPDIDGFEVLRRLQTVRPEPVAIMLTGHASIHHAVQAMRLGAFHYLPKPSDFDDIARVIEEAMNASRVRKKPPAVSTASTDPVARLRGISDAMENVRSLIRRIAASDSATVLITGESGTGKDVAARALHASSKRAARPFIEVACTALPTTLLESELFGHERGAFTDAKARHLGLLEQADGGTVFLDEIGDMDLALQAKLLHVLEHKRFRRIGGTEDITADVRIVAATNVDLARAVAAGRFRSDLYYRLAVLELCMPALRARTSDIAPLAEYFVDRFCQDSDRGRIQLTDAALEKLRQHPWPGNVRELKNVIERSVILATSTVIDADAIILAGPAGDEPNTFHLPPNGLDLKEFEIELLRQALARTGGNATRAGRLLGMNRDQVRYRIGKFGLRDSSTDEDEDDTIS